ncbi:SPFH domain-containing protein [Streptomyces sp. NBC_01591]|uniref:SPFH domain-containing protein n=1 Tax=Streptomyces sp. NBC_01591 TaxID=2975888 RepID=UPI002DDB8703|nr:SPFH domain-containing protein [Streptomyces sp. NBC_01591]WSD68627.1 SPFH domain-containing protein [Streptomyces sp. NBC_01591]
MRSTVSDSSGTPENGRRQEGEREPDRVAPPQREDGGPETGVGPAGPGAAADDGPDSVVDLVLDLVPGEDLESGLGATSASVSVPAMATGAVPGVAPAQVAAGNRTDPGSGTPPPSSPPSPRHRTAPVTVFGSLPVSGSDGVEQSGDTLWGAGRHHAVIANERTAAIPVHLLFREDAARADAAELPVGAMRRGAGGDQPQAGVRRPPAPRGPQVRPPTRPAPVADPRLAERPGPALPGWLALLTGLAGVAAGGAVLWWIGALPAAALARFGIGSRPYDGIGLGAWAVLAALVSVVLFTLGGLSRGRVGYAWVLTLFGEYRGSVRRTGLMWISPLLLRRRVDVRLRHWRSEPLPAVDSNGTALRVVVLVVWRIKDTVRAALGVADHETYLREQVEAAMARVLSQLPADAFHEDAHTLRNAEAVGDALTRMLKADCKPVGIEVYSAQPTGIEYAPEVAAAMQRRRIAAIDAKHRDSVLTSVVDAVDDTVNRLITRGIVELDDYERKSLVKDLTVAFYTGRSGGEGA